MDTRQYGSEAVWISGPSLPAMQASHAPYGHMLFGEGVQLPVIREVCFRACPLLLAHLRIGASSDLERSLMTAESRVSLTERGGGGGRGTDLHVSLSDYEERRRRERVGGLKGTGTDSNVNMAEWSRG